MVKNQEYDRVYDWEDRAGRSYHVGAAPAVQRRRCWSAEEKAAIMQETYAPGMSASLVARRHGIAVTVLVVIGLGHQQGW